VPSEPNSGHDLPPPPPPPEQSSLTVPTGGAVSLKPAAFFPDTKLFEGSTIHPNTAQNIIITTEDKIRNYLHEYSKALATRAQWVTPLGLLITIGATLLTANFKDTLGIKADIWAALFLLLLLASGIWLFVSLVRMLVFWKQASIETLIKKIKKLADG
jgi:hypothetical protein